MSFLSPSGMNSSTSGSGFFPLPFPPPSSASWPPLWPAIALGEVFDIILGLPLGRPGVRFGRENSVLAGFGRPVSPRRCTLPMTALRVTLPSSAAILLADNPSAHNFLRSSTLSSVQPIAKLPSGWSFAICNVPRVLTYAIFPNECSVSLSVDISVAIPVMHKSVRSGPLGQVSHTFVHDGDKWGISLLYGRSLWVRLLSADNAKLLSNKSFYFHDRE